MPAGNTVIAKNEGGPIDVLNDCIDVAVVEEVACCEAARGSGFAQDHTST